MFYNATIRRKLRPATTMTNFRARDILEAAEIVRAKHGLRMDDPHRGFAITEVRHLPTSTRNEK